MPNNIKKEWTMGTINPAIKRCEDAEVATIVRGMQDCSAKHNPNGHNRTDGVIPPDANFIAEDACNEKVVATAQKEEDVCKANAANTTKMQGAKDKLTNVNKGQPPKVTVLDPSVDEKDQKTVEEKFKKPVAKLVAAEIRLAELKKDYTATLDTFNKQMENMDVKEAQKTKAKLQSIISEMRDISIKMEITMRDVVVASNQYDFPGEDILMRKARQSSSNIKSESLALFQQYNKLYTSGIMKAETPFALTEAYGKFKAGE